MMQVKNLLLDTVKVLLKMSSIFIFLKSSVIVFTIYYDNPNCFTKEI
jgi:hypothetical protein